MIALAPSGVSHSIMREPSFCSCLYFFSHRQSVILCSPIVCLFSRRSSSSDSFLSSMFTDLIGIPCIKTEYVGTITCNPFITCSLHSSLCFLKVSASPAVSVWATMDPLLLIRAAVNRALFTSGVSALRTASFSILVRDSGERPWRFCGTGLLSPARITTCLCFVLLIGVVVGFWLLVLF